MPNFLSDFGRSGAGESLSRIPSMAIELGNQQLRASNQSVQSAIDLEKLDIARQGMALQEQKTAADLAESERRQRKMDVELQEMEKEQARLAKRFPLADHPKFRSLTPGQQEYAMKMAKEGGYLDAEGMVTVRGITDMVKSMESSEQIFGAFAKAGSDDLKKVYDKAFTEFQNEKAKGVKANPNKLAELEANMNTAYNSYSLSIGKADEGMKLIRMNAEYDRKMQLLKTRVDGIVRAAQERGKLTGKVQDDLTKYMKGIASAEQAKVRLQSSGGLDSATMALLAKNNPDMATALQTGDKTRAIASLDALIRRYEDGIKALGGTNYLTPPAAAEPAKAEWEDYD
jgi:hypothetical protein